MSIFFIKVNKNMSSGENDNNMWNFKWGEYPIHMQPPTKKNIICPITHPNPNCTLCPHYQINTWPHLLSACSIQHINGLRIARHNIAIHKVAHTLQSNKHTICYNLLNASNQHSRPQDNPIPTWFLQ